jgi:hypothetical protein
MVGRSSELVRNGPFVSTTDAAPSRAKRSFNRFELKYFTDHAQAENFRAALTRRLLVDQGGPYSVWSTYYDTGDLRFYWEKIEGIRFRRKLRVRTYAPPGTVSDDTPVFVEIKQRVNRVTQKRRTAMSLRDARLLCNERQLPNLAEPDGADAGSGSVSDRAFVEEVLAMVERLDLSAVTAVGYQREAFEGTDLDPGLRVTFDRRILGRDRDLDLSADGEGANRVLIDPSLTLIEIKVNEQIPHWLTNSIAINQLELVRVSKYCQSIEALGHAPRSVFHAPEDTAT